MRSSCSTSTGASSKHDGSTAVPYTSPHLVEGRLLHLVQDGPLVLELLHRATVSRSAALSARRSSAFVRARARQIPPYHTADRVAHLCRALLSLNTSEKSIEHMLKGFVVAAAKAGRRQLKSLVAKRCVQPQDTEVPIQRVLIECGNLQLG
jgi:hypothetical protein